MNHEQEERTRLAQPAGGAPHVASTQEEGPRAAWHRPQLERLRVSLDTAQAPGSGTDGGVKTTSLF